MQIAKVPHESAAETRKSIIAQQGFAGYSVKGGRIRVLKEIAGSMELLKEHRSTVVDMQFWNPENEQELDTEDRYLISISLDSILLLWRFKNTGLSQKPISYTVEFGLQGTPSSGSSHRYRQLAWNPANMDIIAVATDSNTVLLIDLSTYMKPSGSPPTPEAELGNMLTEVEVGHAVTSIAFSPDGRQLAIGEASGRILLVELEDATVCSQKHLSKATGNTVTFLSFITQNTNSTLLVASDNNNEIHLRDVSTDSKLHSIKLQSSSGDRNAISYENDSHLLLVGSQTRCSLLALHISLEPTPCFDFVSEHTVPEAILDIDATRDIMSFKEPPASRCISLYTSQINSKSVFVVPASRLYPTSTQPYPLLVGSSQPQQGPTSVPQADADFLAELFSLGSNSAPSDPSPAPLVQEDGSLSLTNLFLAHESISKPKPRQSKAAPKPEACPVQSSIISQEHFPSLTKKDPTPRTDKEVPASKPTLAQVVSRTPEDITSIIKREVSGSAQQNSKDIAKLGGQLNTITRDIKSLPASLNQTLVGEINNSLRDCVQQQIPQILDDRFTLAFKQFLSGKEFHSILESQLKKHAVEAMISSNVTSAIGEAVSDQLAKGVQKVVAQQIESVLIPAYEAASASMFQQMHKSFSEGLKKIHESHEALLSLQQAQLTKVSELLASQKSSPNNLPVPIEGGSSSHPKKNSPQKPEPKHKPTAAPEYSPPKPANKVVSPPSLQVEESISEALATSDHKRLVALFSETSPTSVFKYCEFPQKSMLILAKLMTKELGNHTDLKLSIIKECLSRLLPKDPSISEHIGRFLATIKASLNNFSSKLTGSDSDNQTLATLRALMDSCSTILSPK
ncbi:hypothetical protein DSO57_1000337 [Entomophthora muscae]|uniref:Uncharacterized protein n=1 Tax=Entomophthora muscae TaxID=34485 RepID=A0ACC2TK08_9FUNG|nr:hypothetical protein DSO57_1000337 [Entomophthora muscae]